MRITHKVNHGWAPNQNDPAWEARIEREAVAVTNATERAYVRAQKRLARAQERLEAAAARVGVKPARLAQLEAVVEMRRQELLDLARMMTAHGAPTTSRGRRSYRGVPGTHPL
jgi:hypothetical protein